MPVRPGATRRRGPMSFEPTAEQELVRSTAASIAAEYGPAYWRAQEAEGAFAADFWDELAEADFHGLLIPEAYGGAGMGLAEMGVAMETLCAEGCGMAGTWYLVLTAGMAALGIREHGSDDQQDRYLPDIAAGDRFWLLVIQIS